MNYQILKNPGNLFTIENSPNGERFLSFNSPSAYNPGNNQFDVGIVSYDGFGFVRWNIVKVTVSPDSLRDLPRVSFENQNIERNEEDGSVINMTVQFNKPLTQAARIPVKLKDLGGDYEHHSGLTNINLSTKTGILEMAAGSQEKTFKLTLNDDSAWINGSETVRIDILAPPTDQGIIWRRSLPAEHDGSFVNLKIIDNDKPKLRLYFPDHYPTTYREDSLASGSARQYDPPAFPLIAHAGLSLGAENVENGGVTKLPDEFEVYLSITPTDRTAYFNGIKDNWFYTVKYYQNGFNSDYWPLKVEISSNGIFSGQVFEKRELYSNGRYGDGTYTNGVLPVALYLNEISADTGITLSLEPQDHYELSGDSQLELQGINVD